MRIARLDLLRFGKFTDRRIELPRAKRDFHLIVGPNEAGKSTLRSAVLDLLFGIETRSPYNFLHPHPDMRLGASIEHDGATLDFERIKARTRTLQGPGGEPLADDALLPFLGTVDRGFFDQMFGLDHDRLVAGGREILSASNDVGRILFQSAAGIGSLGEVRDALESEAEGLWARRRSGQREYYVAADELAAADAALKQATVRTKEWVAAHSLVDALQEKLDAARESYRELEDKRTRLDRIRRAAPHLESLRASRLALDELGVVIKLPESAAQQLMASRQVIAKAQAALAHSRDRAARLNTQLAQLPARDEALLARRADLEALSELRHQLRKHPADIAKRKDEVRMHWARAQGHVKQLGWSVGSDVELEQRLPGKLLRAELSGLIRRHDGVEQHRKAASEARATRESEISRVDKELQALPDLQVSPSLRQALAAAQGLGDIAGQSRQLEAQVSRARRNLDSASLELGAWRPALESLRSMELPSADELNALQRRLGELESVGTGLAERLADKESELAEATLAIEQYASAHHPVSLEHLNRARAERDEVWQGIKSGALTLQAGAAEFEPRVKQADDLSDLRHDKAQEASELQARLDQKQRLEQQLAELLARRERNLLERKDFDDAWANRAIALGLVGMPVLGLGQWRATRDKVLRAADDLTDAADAERAFRARCDAAQAELARALDGVLADAAALSLASLVTQAADIVATAVRTDERRQALMAQKRVAEPALASAVLNLATAQAALEEWRTAWATTLAAAHLPADASTTLAAGALTLFEEMSDDLRQMRELKTARIDTMQLDLDNFAAQAEARAAELAPELIGQAADAIAIALEKRLQAALEAERERTRLQAELDEALQSCEEGAAAIRDAEAGLAPLLGMAAVDRHDELDTLIDRSDRERALTAALRAEEEALRRTGDGLPIAELAAECASVDLPGIAGELEALKARVDEVVAEQNHATAALQEAKASLGRIAGQDEAARAESQRQEALARMANAAERYVKVVTAAKLLRWAIERYREAKQGPMLGRAGAIFSSLTLGSFSRLVVDHESEPLKLHGVRAAGELVSIEGMSDGTRDQLYLALRLAALELHLETAPAMPFIADDLVINYDDARSKAALQALAHLSEMTQVIFLSHHDHLVPVAKSVFGPSLNVVRMEESDQEVVSFVA